MNLGENIHDFRVKQGMSQGDLAAALEVSRQSVSKWENNAALPELDKLVRMSKLFNITLDELVYGRQETEPLQVQIPIAIQSESAAMPEPMEDESPAPLAATPTPAAVPEGVPFMQPIPVRILVGTVLLLIGMIFFLLSIFWGDHLAFGEELGEFLSINTVLLSIALLATYNHKVLAACAVIYMGYAAVCFGILNVTSMTNYLFMFLSSAVLFVWFLVWGTKASKEAVAGN